MDRSRSRKADKKRPTKITSWEEENEEETCSMRKSKRTKPRVGGRDGQGEWGRTVG